MKHNLRQELNHGVSAAVNTLFNAEPGSPEETRQTLEKICRKAASVLEAVPKDQRDFLETYVYDLTATALKAWHTENRPKSDYKMSIDMLSGYLNSTK